MGLKQNTKWKYDVGVPDSVIAYLAFINDTATASSNPAEKAEAKRMFTVFNDTLTKLTTPGVQPDKQLDFQPHLADLSDCDSTYVGGENSPYRMVTRVLDPVEGSSKSLLEVVAFGPRHDMWVYKQASKNIKRPVGQRMPAHTVNVPLPGSLRRSQPKPPQLPQPKQPPVNIEPHPTAPVGVSPESNQSEITYDR